MQSKKLVKPFDELTRPYKIKPTQPIEGGINDHQFYFPPGIVSEITFSEYCSILNSSMRDQLWN